MILFYKRDSNSINSYLSVTDSSFIETQIPPMMLVVN